MTDKRKFFRDTMIGELCSLQCTGLGVGGVVEEGNYELGSSEGRWFYIVAACFRPSCSRIVS